MTTQALFALSAAHGHLYINPKKVDGIDSAAVLLPSGRCAWTVSKHGTNSKEYRNKVSHEIGHCEKRAFYTRLSAPTTRGKCEESARRWQYEKMVPCEELISAFDRGIRTAWELAEEFDMPEDFVKKAVEYYKVRGDLYDLPQMPSGGR